MFRREMISVIMVMGLATLAMSILGPVMPPYLTSIGVSPVMVGLMLSSAMIGMAVGETSWGWLADKAGFRLSMIIGTFVSGLSVALFIFTRNYVLVFAIFVLWGFARSALFGPSRGYVGALAPSHKKATFMAITAVMMSGSRSLAALPSGFMVESWGYSSVFIASAVISLLGGLLVVTVMRKSSLSVSANIGNAAPGDTEIASENGRINYFSLTPQCVVTALQFLGLGATMTFLPLLATQVIGAKISEVGILFTINGLVNVALGIPAGMIADRFGKKKIMIIGLLISAGGMLGISNAASYAWLVVSAVINSSGMVLFSPAALGLLSDSVPARRQSTAMGFYGGVCENVGIITGSALGGVVWDVLGPRSTFLMGSISAAAAALVCLLIVRDRSKREITG